jgi:hypothetical protein
MIKVKATTFQSLFHSNDSARDKFLSRLFGIFNEEIVRCWGKAPQAPYEELGRPTIRKVGEKRGYTLDFTLRSKNDDRIYIAEMKCELEYENYRYLTLESPSQLDHHGKEAFRIFLDAARNMRQYIVTIKGQPQMINGSILIWGRYTEEGRINVMNKYGLGDVLSLEAIINDLVVWRNQDYTELIHKYERWSSELFTGLKSIRESLG